MHSVFRRLSLCLLLTAGSVPALAQQAPDDRPRRDRADRDNQQRPERPRPPAPDAVTPQTVELPGRSLHFTATAGFV